MDALVQHLQQHMLVYLAGLACLVPIVYITRRWAVPLLLYVAEFVIYVVFMHLFIHGAVAFGSWYRQESTFRVLADGTRTVEADWGTPLVEAWTRELYRPEWLFYVEAALVVAIIVCMYRYRPLRVQQPKPKSASRPAGRYSRPGAPPPPASRNPR